MKPHQESLPLGLPDTASTHKDRLFLAVMPPLAIAALILTMAKRFCADLGLAGKLLQQDRLHCTLFCFELRKGVPETLVEMIARAVSRIAAAPFDVTFSVAESFAQKPRDRPFVLLGKDDDLLAICDFQRLLMTNLKEAGLTRFVDTGFTPHVTMLYDNRAVSKTLITPVIWTVNEFLLIHSLVGKTEYRILKRWPLTGDWMADSPAPEPERASSEKPWKTATPKPALARAA